MKILILKKYKNLNFFEFNNEVKFILIGNFHANNNLKPKIQKLKKKQTFNPTFSNFIKIFIFFFSYSKD